MTEPHDNPAAFAVAYPNLALARLGAAVTATSDEFFAPGARCIAAPAPVFIPDKFDDHGKWMDGWESRRRRQDPPDHDWLVLRLGAPAIIHGINACTRHFTGNYPPHAALDAAVDDGDAWQEVVGRADLGPDCDNHLELTSTGPWRRLRLRIYPDGGIARLRVHGLFVPAAHAGERVDLVSLLHGGRVVGFSDAHFGAPANMLMPDLPLNMGDGWETARRRGPGHDWVVLALGSAGVPDAIEVGTRYFKGNYPASCTIQAAAMAGATDAEVVAASTGWPELVGDTPLAADTTAALKPNATRPITHLRLNIYPDGGISRLRVFGEVAG